MNRNDLRRVDLNLLIVFETLMHERSVTRAAEKLFLGQPAISAALSRLRTLFDDPLFVRTGRSMEPTARAQEIFAHLSPALDSISTAMSRASEFDPATSTAVFRIGLSDDVEFGLLPPLLRRLRAEAPGIVLVVRRCRCRCRRRLPATGARPPAAHRRPAVRSFPPHTRWRGSPVAARLAPPIRRARRTRSGGIRTEQPDAARRRPLPWVVLAWSRARRRGAARKARRGWAKRGIG